MRRALALMLAILLCVGSLPAASASAESTASGAAAVLPEDIPSDWAYEGVQKAILLGMVPQRMQRRWRNPVTRVEMAEMAIHFMAFQYGFRNDNSFISSYCAGTTDRDGRSFGSSTAGSWWNQFCGAAEPFADLLLPEDRGYGNAAYALGLVNGRSAVTYDPSGLVTRQEAAAILMRCYRRYGGAYQGADVSAQFADWAEIDDWAAADVSAVVSMGVMNGTGGGRFTPEGTCTREQMVLMLLRMYNYAPVSRLKQNVPAV